LLLTQAETLSSDGALTDCAVHVINLSQPHNAPS
jgi:hypothetical protein